MKKLLLILISVLLPLQAGAQELDMQEYLFGHIGDSYEWHITTVKDKPVCVYLRLTCNFPCETIQRFCLV